MAVEYVLSLPSPHTHLLEVEVRLAAAADPVDFVMPAWAPGSYLIREFARNVQGFQATDAAGLRLRCTKLDKATWRVEGHERGPVVVRYHVYANELSVRTSHMDASHAFVSGSSVFMYSPGTEGEPVRLRVEAPDGWRVATSLHETETGEFLAADYDELVDCPLEIGPHRTIAWTRQGVPHRFAVWGDTAIDEKRLIADTQRIIDVCAEMFGGIPYERYLFILHLLPEGRGGLEHRSSCALQVPPAWVTEPEYEHLLALIAHEFFHVWLGKRIRPEPLGPFDYTRENYTRHLWVVEGFTTYYTDLILLRAGLIGRARYLERLGDSIARLRSLPGRHQQTLEESSFDTWIRFYRPDASTPNAQVSYYHKGSLVALALDLEIRRRTRGERSLDDVMRVLWERFGARDDGFPEDEGILGVVEEVYGDRMDGLFARYVTGTAEIDFDGHLEGVGLELVAQPGYGGAGGGGEAGGPGKEAVGGAPGEEPAFGPAGSPQGSVTRVITATGSDPLPQIADSAEAMEQGPGREDAGHSPPDVGAVGSAGGDGGAAGESAAGGAGGARADAPAPAGGGPPASGAAAAGTSRGSSAVRAAARLRPPPPSPAEWRLGFRLQEGSPRLLVAYVLAGSPAYGAGLNAGDELVAVGAVRASATSLAAALREAEPDGVLELVVLRRDRLLAFAAKLDRAVPRLARIVPVEGATAEQVAVREGWLGAGG